MHVWVQERLQYTSDGAHTVYIGPNGAVHTLEEAIAVAQTAYHSNTYTYSAGWVVPRGAKHLSGAVLTLSDADDDKVVEDLQARIRVRQRAGINCLFGISY